MLILNMGVPRSGTVLVNAIIRALFANRKLPLQQANPHGPEVERLVGTLLRTGTLGYRNVLMHGHTMEQVAIDRLRGSAHVTGVVNYRDPRDVTVSLMQLHELAFKAALDHVARCFEHMERAALQLDVAVVPYELLMQDKPSHIFQIARRLGFWPDLAEVEAIDAATTLEKHKAVMEGVRDGTIEGVQERPNRRRVLREDPATLINDRHIQSGKRGRWRDELDAAQQAEAAETFAVILRRYGYAEN